MKKTIIAMLALVAAAAFGTPAMAGVIGFDDLPGDGTTPITGGYAGFDWDNVGTISSANGAGSGFETGTVSPSNTAFNWYGGTSTISTANGAGFDFAGAFFTSAYVDQEISFEGSLGGQLVYASGAFTLDTVTPQWIGLDWAGIDTLTIYNSSGTQWAMDDFTATTITTDVPEPATLALFGSALAGMVGARGRMRRTRR